MFIEKLYCKISESSWQSGEDRISFFMMTPHRNQTTNLKQLCLKNYWQHNYIAHILPCLRKFLIHQLRKHLECQEDFFPNQILSL